MKRRLPHRFTRLFAATVLTLSALAALLPGVASAVVINNCAPANVVAMLESGGDYTFNCGNATIVLPEQIDITINTSVDGGGQITLDGGDATRIFEVADDVTLTLTGLTLQNGYTSGNGGAIRVAGGTSAGTIIVSDTSFLDNRADTFGGAISWDATLASNSSVTDSTFEGNSAANGGAVGITNGEEALNMSNSTFTGNTADTDGGALFLDSIDDIRSISFNEFSGNSAGDDGGAIAVVNLANNNDLANNIIDDNEAADDGGGVALDTSGTNLFAGNVITNNRALGDDGGGVWMLNVDVVTLRGAVIRGNSAPDDGGGVYDDAGNVVDITDAVIDDNFADDDGGGLLLIESTNVQITRSAITNNVSNDNGGGIFAESVQVVMTNSTVSSNDAGESGGGLWINDALNTTTFAINSSTIANNTAAVDGGGIYTDGGTITVQNSIIALNSPRNCDDPLTSNDYNLDDDDSCGLTDPTDIVSVPALLGPLADNGGNTLTHRLLAGSPAIDTGNCPTLTVDQRNAPRPADGDNNGSNICDRGAFEVSLLADRLALRSSLSRHDSGDPLYVRFSLGGNFGTGILASAAWQPVACGSGEAIGSEQPVSLIRGLQYFAGGKYYQLIVRTQESWGTSCRQMILRFSDGSIARVDVRFVPGDDN